LSDRVDDAFALQALEPGLDDRPLGGVDHHRHARDVGLRSDEVEEGHHRLLRVEHRLVHVDVDHLRAVVDLLARHGERFLVVAGEDEAGERLRTRDVGAFADVDEQRFVADVERLESREAQLLLYPGNLPGRQRLDRARDRMDVRGRRATAAADDVEETAFGELLQLAGGVFGRLVVAGLRERVRQSRVRIAAQMGVGDLGQFLDVRAHQLCAERAVEAHRDRARVAHRVPERLGRLPGEGAARLVGDGARDDDRQAPAALLEQRLDRENRRFGVERVEDRFQQEQVGAAVGKAGERFAVCAHELVEVDVAKAGVVDVGRDRRGLVGGAEHSGDEARLARIAPGVFVRGVARDPGGLEVQLVDQALEAVVGLRGRIGIESVGLDDVRAGGEVTRMDLADDLRPRQREQIVVAAQVARRIREAGAAEIGLRELVALDGRAHGPVEDQDAAIQQGAEFVGSVGLHFDLGSIIAHCGL
jgi:hypothetical protein